MAKLELYVKVVDGKVTTAPGPLDVVIAHNIPEESRVASGWYPIERNIPESFSADTEVWESESFEIKSDHVVWTLNKRSKTAEELAAEREVWWKGHRIERNFRLAESDWVVTKSLEQGQPVPQEWLDYRQALRDITANPDFNGSNYPQKPNA